jgi:3-dehydroquinate dehydratase
VSTVRSRPWKTFKTLKRFWSLTGRHRHHIRIELRGAILEFIHESAKSSDAYLINPASLTEGGVATKHALTEMGKPYIEVHFANIVAPPIAPRGLPIRPWAFNI